MGGIEPSDIRRYLATAGFARRSLHRELRMRPSRLADGRPNVRPPGSSPDRPDLASRRAAAVGLTAPPAPIRAARG